MFAEDDRTGQARHDADPATAYVPAPQLPQVSDAEVGAANPAGHRSHDREPLDPAYRPGMHSRHLIVCLRSAYLPGGQGSMLSLPPRQKKPGSHSRWPAVPAGVGTHAVEALTVL